MQNAGVLCVIASSDGDRAPQMPSRKVLLAVLVTDSERRMLRKGGNGPAAIDNTRTAWVVLGCCIGDRPHVKSIELIFKV